MQVLRARQIDEEGEENNHMGKPENTEQDEIGFSSQSANRRSEPHAKEGPQRSIACCITKGFDQDYCDKYEQNKPQYDQAIPWTMQKAEELFRTYDRSSESENAQSNCNKDDKKIHESCKCVTVTKNWQSESKTLQHEIEQCDRDDNESPEREEMSYAGDGIAQHTTLSKYNLEKLAYAILDMIGTVLTSRFYQ